MFSHKKELIPLLSIVSVLFQEKLNALLALISLTLVSARYRGKNVYQRESNQKKLQDENTCFSKILLASRMSRPDDYSSYVKFLCILLRKNVL